jgi:hypothetical protein
MPLRGARYAAGSALRCATEATALAAVDLCLVTVKSRDTAEVADQLAAVLPPECEVLSLAGPAGRAPCNRLVVDVVHRLEAARAAGRPCPFLSARALRAEMTAASASP